MSGNRTRRRALWIALPLCLLYTAGALTGWGGPAAATVMGDFGLAAAALAAAVSCFLRAAGLTGKPRWSWILFGLSATMIAAGNTVWGWYEVVLGRPVPTPGPADVCFLFFAPPVIAGLILVAQPPAGLADRLCRALDAWLVAGSLFTLGWTVALAGAADGERAGGLRVAVALAYPVMDILLISMVLGLRLRPGPADRTAVGVAVAALAVTVVTDALWTAPGLNGSYSSGQVLDAGWFTGSVLLAAAPWAGGRDAGPHERRRGRAVSMLSALTPYIAAAVCTAGVVGGAVAGRAPDTVVLAAGGSVLLALVLRQGITLVDNVFMAQELAAKESHFRSLVQGSSDVIMIASRDGVLRYVSHAVRRVHGFEPEELQGTRLELLIHPDDSARVQRELAAFLAAADADEEAMTRIQCRVRSAGAGWLHTESAVNRYGDGILLSSRDVTERVREQARLEHDAFHDRLTGLPNRALFEDRIQHALAQRRGVTPTVAVMFVDLDGFKAVNDTQGHAVGDELLVQAARRLDHAVRAGDTVARFGGDEFAALLVGDASESAIREIAARLLGTLCAPYHVGGTEVRVAASIGIAFSAPGIAPAELMHQADVAMYRAKSAGKARVEVYTDPPREERRPGVPAQAGGPARRAGRHRPARPEPVPVAWQPVVDLADGRVVAVQALTRHAAPGRTGAAAEPLRLPAPGREDGGPRARDLLEAVTRGAARWHDEGLTAAVCVGVTPERIGTPGFADLVDRTLRRAALPAAALTLEIAGGCPGGPDALPDRLAELGALGVRLCVDDFGVGHSSPARLRELPVDGLRIDRSFVGEIGTCPHVTALTSTIVRLGLDLGLTLTASGVESRAQMAALRDMGCHRAQGFLFSGPLDDTGVLRVLRRGPLTRGATVPQARNGSRPPGPAPARGHLPDPRAGRSPDAACPTE